MPPKKTKKSVIGSVSIGGSVPRTSFSGAKEKQPSVLISPANDIGDHVNDVTRTNALMLKEQLIYDAQQRSKAEIACHLRRDNGKSSGYYCNGCLTPNISGRAASANGYTNASSLSSTIGYSKSVVHVCNSCIALYKDQTHIHPLFNGGSYRGVSTLSLSKEKKNILLGDDTLDEEGISDERYTKNNTGLDFLSKTVYNSDLYNSIDEDTLRLTSGKLLDIITFFSHQLTSNNAARNVISLTASMQSSLSHGPPRGCSPSAHRAPSLNISLSGNSMSNSHRHSSSRYILSSSVSDAPSHSAQTMCPANPHTKLLAKVAKYIAQLSTAQTDQGALATDSSSITSDHSSSFYQHQTQSLIFSLLTDVKATSLKGLREFMYSAISSIQQIAAERHERKAIEYYRQMPHLRLNDVVDLVKGGRTIAGEGASGTVRVGFLRLPNLPDVKDRGGTHDINNGMDTMLPPPSSIISSSAVPWVHWWGIVHNSDTNTNASKDANLRMPISSSVRLPPHPPLVAVKLVNAPVKDSRRFRMMLAESGMLKHLMFDFRKVQERMECWMRASTEAYPRSLVECSTAVNDGNTDPFTSSANILRNLFSGDSPEALVPFDILPKFKETSSSVHNTEPSSEDEPDSKIEGGRLRGLPHPNLVGSVIVVPYSGVDLDEAETGDTGNYHQLGPLSKCTVDIAALHATGRHLSGVEQEKMDGILIRHFYELFGCPLPVPLQALRPSQPLYPASGGPPQDPYNMSLTSPRHPFETPRSGRGLNNNTLLRPDVRAERCPHRCAFVLEYCDGGTLKQYVVNYSNLNQPVQQEPVQPTIDSYHQPPSYTAHQGLPADQASAIFYPILLGLDYLHSVLGVLHRDIKPENILLCKTDSGLNARGGVCTDPTIPVDSDPQANEEQLNISPFNTHFISQELWRVKLADFGISRPVDSAKTACGTRRYMAPEVMNPMLLRNMAMEQLRSQTDSTTPSQHQRYLIAGSTKGVDFIGSAYQQDETQESLKHRDSESFYTYGKSADVYSLGVVLQFMLCGGNPQALGAQWVIGSSSMEKAKEESDVAAISDTSNIHNKHPHRSSSLHTNHTSQHGGGVWEVPDRLLCHCHHNALPSSVCLECKGLTNVILQLVNNMTSTNPVERPTLQELFVHPFVLQYGTFEEVTNGNANSTGSDSGVSDVVLRAAFQQWWGLRHFPPKSAATTDSLGHEALKGANGVCIIHNAVKAAINRGDIITETTTPSPLLPPSYTSCSTLIKELHRDISPTTHGEIEAPSLISPHHFHNLTSLFPGLVFVPQSCAFLGKDIPSIYSPAPTQQGEASHIVKSVMDKYHARANAEMNTSEDIRRVEQNSGLIAIDEFVRFKEYIVHYNLQKAKQKNQASIDNRRNQKDSLSTSSDTDSSSIDTSDISTAPESGVAHASDLQKSQNTQISRCRKIPGRKNPSRLKQSQVNKSVGFFTRLREILGGNLKEPVGKKDIRGYGKAQKLNVNSCHSSGFKTKKESKTDPNSFPWCFSRSG